jgi:hypothetical protein
MEDSDGDMLEEASMIIFCVRYVLSSVVEREDRPAWEGGRVLPHHGRDPLGGDCSSAVTSPQICGTADSEFIKQ